MGGSATNGSATNGNSSTSASNGSSTGGGGATGTGAGGATGTGGNGGNGGSPTGGAGAGSGPSLEAGRYVGNGVYVGAKQGTTGGQTQATVQIDITKGLKAQTDVGTGQGGNSVGLSYQFEY